MVELRSRQLHSRIALIICRVSICRVSKFVAFAAAYHQHCSHRGEVQTWPVRRRRRARFACPPHTPYLHMSPPGCFLTPQSDGRRDASQLFLPNANGKNPKKKCVAMVAWLVPMSENRKKKTSQKAAGSEEEFECGD